jgi:hypothetical protein
VRKGYLSDGTLLRSVGTSILVLGSAAWLAAVFGADVLAVVAMYAYGPRVSGSALSPLYAALHPFGAAVFIYATLRSAFVTLAKGGIEWRGTFYPLRVLREDVP